MRRYILTARDRRILKAYLDEGLKLDGFTTLAHQARRIDLDLLREDLALIELFNRRIKRLF